MEQNVQEILDEAPKLYVEDGPALVTILSPRRLDTIISTCERFADKTPALISFLVALRNSDTACPEETNKEAFAAVLRTMLSNFNLTHDPKDVRLKAHERPRPQRGCRSAPPLPRTPCLDSDALVQLTTQLLADKDTEGLSTLARNLGAQTSCIDVRDFDAVLLPFLHSLARTADPTVLTALHHNDDDPLRTLYATTLSAYRSRHLRPPPEFNGWVARLKEAGVDWRVVLGEGVYERVVEGKEESALAEGGVNKRKALEGTGRSVRRRMEQTDVVDLADDEPWRR
ncbi:putative 2og-fe oxygenase superfamily protein [Diplodia seriata]|uniref:Putative 2og-fe oxygenase superfamily protein n=1 Tax=Diplodia seriata TaxID=420778 RepID=A0A0G2E6I2_9PEZI|nr:putative 2og-fe oxygenase superfamily protein [Diplodia seriata]